MALFTKPTKVARWATNATRTLEPSSGEKDVGWEVDKKPPARKMNWLQWVAYGWFGWLNERLFDGATDDDLTVSGVDGTGTDDDGGTCKIQGGESTGDGGSKVELAVALANQGSGTTPRATTVKATLDEDGHLKTDAIEVTTTDADDALTVDATGGSGDAIVADASAGSGLKATSTAASGVEGTGATFGMKGIGVTNGVGVEGTGGTTSGSGVKGTAGSANAFGVEGVGGTGASSAGVKAAAGTGGSALLVDGNIQVSNGGADFGIGSAPGTLIQGTPSGSNDAISIQGGGTGGDGIQADGGGTSGSGAGGRFLGGAPNGRGVVATGNGTGPGVDASSSSGIGGLFSANATRGSISLVPTSTQPSTPGNGELYYDLTTHKLRLYANGAWVNLN
jgi:hypothetical protein